MLIDGAAQDIQVVLASRRKLPVVSGSPSQILVSKRKSAL
jgi:hypothetical protein